MFNHAKRAFNFWISKGPLISGGSAKRQFYPDVYRQFYPDVYTSQFSPDVYI